jgi:hypothetical protein
MSEAPPDDHPPAPPVGLPEDAKQALQEARAKLERTTLADRMLEQAGRPIEKGLARLPDRAKRWVEVGTYKSLDVALRIAIRTLSGSEGPGGVGAADPPLKRSGGATRSPRDRLHQAAVAAAGTTGFFGLIALPVELPVTTALMLRSIADIARIRRRGSPASRSSPCGAAATGTHRSGTSGFAPFYRGLCARPRSTSPAAARWISRRRSWCG